ncbi:exosortase V [Sphingomonas sp. SE220]|uniref:Exosortase V n=2 Tax=Sphingomonas hankyongi TaxID=2908209 RepID=A0ABT0S2M0_9SPHN|nr:exosortase V [Sphingomonas hankyongi]MCL6730117.1 exosortase V [Sphingomonas hankyongi]
MSSVAPPSPTPQTNDLWRVFSQRFKEYWPLILGIAALAIPTIVSVASEIWSTEDGAHGPIVLASGIWLLARLWPRMLLVARPPALKHALAWMAPALFVYVFGRLVGVLGIEVFGLMASLYGLIFALGGAPAVRVLWFPLVYLAFLIPLPDTVVAILTQPMKLGISEAATALLHGLGYPVANTGVTLQVGPYQLLVAAACSGLNAIISLSAIGLFYVYLMHSSSWRYALFLLFFVVPCAIFANFVRVVVLILLNYYAGDEVAQSFLHDLAGMMTFALAVLMIFTIDHLLRPIRQRLGAG